MAKLNYNEHLFVISTENKKHLFVNLLRHEKEKFTKDFFLCNNTEIFLSAFGINQGG